MHFKRFECVWECVCVCVWVCNICNRLPRRGCGRLYWCQCCCCFCCILKCATPRSAPSLVPVAPSLRATHLHSGALILWHSFVVGGSLMHVTCRARDFRAYLALDVQQENREKMKFLTCCVLQAERGVANQRERERERYGGMRFIVYMFYVISNLCSNSNRRRAKPPQHCIHTCSCLKWQHPLATWCGNCGKF